MYKKRNILPVIFALALLCSSCESSIDEFSPHAGDIDFTTYVAIGNSLTAGFRDGELFRSGQEQSLANIMASQFMHVGLSSFKQPLMKDELGFGSRLILGTLEDGSPFPMPMPGTPDAGNFVNIFQEEGPFHNLGVPGATAAHLLFEGYGTLNPYYGRFASDPASSSVLGDAMMLSPTFFSLWAGNNEILGFAMNGGQGGGITPPTMFQEYLQILVSTLTSGGAKGVLGNIVDITTIPFFTTVPYNALVLTDPDLVALLNAAYAAAPHIEFSVGPNPLVVADTDHPAGLRQMEAGELVVLTALDGISNQFWGSQVPLPMEYYLSQAEIDQVTQAVKSYNDIIQDVGFEAGLAVADINSVLRNAEPGIYYDAIGFSTEFVTGGVFSLDGVHLSARGSAITAGYFIQAINQQYNAAIPKPVIGNYPGIQFP